MRRAVILLLPSLAFGAPAPAADDSVITTPGRELVERWCSECHSIDEAGLLPPLNAPTFQEVADDPSTTEASLTAFFTTPHPPMPDYRLTAEEINDVIAFILSLRRR